jgi:hypothetical protein
MFGKDDDSQDQTATADPVQPAFGQSLTMPEPTGDGSATSTSDATTSPTVPADGSTEESSSDNNTEGNNMADQAPAVANDDLLKIKQSALQNLAPLVGQLDQTPEEKFKTTMMMIQAGDDSTLIQSAYDTANQISDEKLRAQALLDIVNEINYFTQQHNK